MAEQDQIDIVVSSFNNSPLSIFFPNIETDAGVALVAELAAFIIDCDFEMIRTSCPNLWSCFSAYKLAVLLATWPVEISVGEGGGEIVVGDIGKCGPEVITYLKRKRTGMRECEWALYEPKTKNCPPSALEQWNAVLEQMRADCKLSQTQLFMGGGSNWPDCENKCGCDDGANKWHQW